MTEKKIKYKSFAGDLLKGYGGIITAFATISLFGNFFASSYENMEICAYAALTGAASYFIGDRMHRRELAERILKLEQRKTKALEQIAEEK